MTHVKRQRTWERWLPNRKRVADEEILYFMRRHWFVLLIKYFFVLIFALLPIPIAFLLSESFPSVFTDQNMRMMGYLGLTIYYLFIWAISYTIFIDYYLDLWLVTTRRIVDREQKGLFNLRISEQSLSQVQDVSASVKGIFPTFLRYGNVLVQTAASQSLFKFQQIPYPEKISREVNKIAFEFKKQQQDQEANTKAQ